ncbi:addiction module antidote protein [Falsiroseomonas frigidaquae]|nr:addiction module antidote protein [Falsiroseomonas frigidaquae]
MAKTQEFDPAELLDDQETQARYLRLALEEDGLPGLMQALGTVARARGMASVAEATGLGRESLYKTLRETGNPRVETLMQVLDALGMRLTVEPAGTPLT